MCDQNYKKKQMGFINLIKHIRSNFRSYEQDSFDHKAGKKNTLEAFGFGKPKAHNINNG